ncbi:YegP family protein [Cerasicoccus frondis]|uniref:YegP family protein n=1 Tax=Cerasicoccus frondis TaxID=490090 RepID=UPI0028524A8D|nr:DUF1508 domain-containing protein [Cerasicoccus frondis]
MKKKAKTKLKPGTTYLRDRADKWRWRVVSNNNEIIGASSQGFTRKADAERNLALLRASQ